MSTPLEELGALAHRVTDREPLPPDSLSSDLDDRYLVAINRLAWMQKESLVTNRSTENTWRISSDEGDYLDAADIAPPPLGNMTAGLTSIYMAAVRESSVDVEDLTATLDCYYTSTGSRLGGTLEVGALAPELHVQVNTPADEATAQAEIQRAVERTPAHGLLGSTHTNRFTLTHNGETIDPGGLPQADIEPPEPPNATFDALERGYGDRDPPIVRHTSETTEPLDDAEAHWDAKLEAEGADPSTRVLHLRGIGTVDPDGLHRIRQETFAPLASAFEFIADEPITSGDSGRAPDGLSYVSAAIPFCLTTHLEQIAKIEDVDIDYHILQESAFSWGENAGKADPLVTHLYLESSADHEFAQQAIDFSELACFLHAICTDFVEPEISVETV